MLVQQATNIGVRRPGSEAKYTHDYAMAYNNNEISSNSLLHFLVQPLSQYLGRYSSAFLFEVGILSSNT